MKDVMRTSSLCVPRTEALEFVRFEGLDVEYPDWFRERLIFGYAGKHVDNSDIFCYTRDDGHVDTVCIGDVFLRNFKGDIMYMSVWDFSEQYFEVD